MDYMYCQLLKGIVFRIPCLISSATHSARISKMFVVGVRAYKDERAHGGIHTRLLWVPEVDLRVT